MLRRIVGFVIIFLGIGASASANCPSYTYTLTNGTTADASQVMANFNTIMNCANTLVSPLAGGFVNVLRNASLTSWFHGGASTFTVPATTGGWSAEGVYVVPTGASVSIARGGMLGGSGSLISVEIAGASGVTDVKVRFVVESYIAQRLSGQTVTFQILWANDTGATVTPTLTTAYPSAQDTWSTVTTDISANLQSCATSSNCPAAYTFTASSSTNVGNGYEFVVDFGNNFGSTSNSIFIATFDARVTPGVATGLNSSPPAVERHDPAADNAWNQRYFQSSYDNYVVPGTATATGDVSGTSAPSVSNGAAMYFSSRLGVPMRVDPTVTLYSPSAGTSGKIDINGSPSSATATAGQGAVGPITNGSGSSWSTALGFAFHYTADATIPGG
jgi:hypothetical protein